jgi:hypothetical protein
VPLPSDDHTTNHWDIATLVQKVKSNKKDCEQLATRTARILEDVWGQTRDYRELPVEALNSLLEINRSVSSSIVLAQRSIVTMLCRIFDEISDFMSQLRNQNPFQRYSLQDVNKARIADFTRQLDEAVVLFGVTVPIFRIVCTFIQRC